jgi:hypothetical protein
MIAASELMPPACSRGSGVVGACIPPGSQPPWVKDWMPCSAPASRCPLFSAAACPVLHASPAGAATGVLVSRRWVGELGLGHAGPRLSATCMPHHVPHHGARPAAPCSRTMVRTRSPLLPHHGAHPQPPAPAPWCAPAAPLLTSQPCGHQPSNHQVRAHGHHGPDIVVGADGQSLQSRHGREMRACEGHGLYGPP